MPGIIYTADNHKTFNEPVIFAIHYKIVDPALP